MYIVFNILKCAEINSDIGMWMNKYNFILYVPTAQLSTVVVLQILIIFKNSC